VKLVRDLGGSFARGVTFFVNLYATDNFVPKKKICPRVGGGRRGLIRELTWDIQTQWLRQERWRFYNSHFMAVLS
jgi:hypothetical protein